MRPLFLYAPNLKRYESEYLSSSNGWKAISVTGTYCAFNCKHCGRRVLESMIDGSNLYKIEEELSKAIARGDKGIILSGGSTSRGDVPIWKYSKLLSKYSDRLTIIAHTGVIKNEEIAQKFKESGVKIALLDMVGDNETINSVLGQPFTVDDYLNSFRYLKKVGIRVAPHVIIGLSKKGIEGDLEAIRLLKEVNPDALIIVGLMPLVGTKMVNSRQPSPDDMIRGLKVARDLFNDIPINLGCARPRGKHYLDVEKFAVDYDIDGIAFPEDETFEYARNKRKVFLSHACCGNVILDLMEVINS
ncbi:radical SAM protein [Sulfolobus sp. A20]|uniref:radical SAM protein n=1 Tax=Sulfolobaceae TaxID=118883 RepID=UPI00084612FD|nr:MULTISPECIES: radical SAM protein [unclassified Sulfolobus]TRM75453.1 radical SAM protein [Sulfolobus sp. E5]TRM77042.1 radical SAM protein [Sulfolobus sp. A20-N-F8]TRM83748.1 radical SAM protein [Sulfolobus sp. A20-N-F6]TRM88450.1 radical SAM protein [Sulfolobus sp. C3]TRM99126.1 radical SAM protein [Sulfolobus sp. E1]